MMSTTSRGMGRVSHGGSAPPHRSHLPRLLPLYRYRVSMLNRVGARSVVAPVDGVPAGGGARAEAERTHNARHALDAAGLPWAAGAMLRVGFWGIVASPEPPPRAMCRSADGGPPLAPLPAALGAHTAEEMRDQFGVRYTRDASRTRATAHALSPSHSSHPPLHLPLQVHPSAGSVLGAAGPAALLPGRRPRRQLPGRRRALLLGLGARDVRAGRLLRALSARHRLHADDDHRADGGARAAL